MTNDDGFDNVCGGCVDGCSDCVATCEGCEKYRCECCRDCDGTGGYIFDGTPAPTPLECESCNGTGRAKAVAS